MITVKPFSKNTPESKHASVGTSSDGKTLAVGVPSGPQTYIRSSKIVFSEMGTPPLFNCPTYTSTMIIESLPLLHIIICVVKVVVVIELGDIYTTTYKNYL